MKNKMKILHCCPVCNGNGLVPNGFYTQTSGDWPTSSATPETCRSCRGTGVLWHDEVINECASGYHCTLGDLIDHEGIFNEEVIEKDYEILAYSPTKDGEFNIESVKRLSDGEVFSVGYKDKYEGIIKSFRETETGLIVVLEDSSFIVKVPSTCTLDDLEKSRKPEKDYEILKCTGWRDQEGFKIYSVKRLSDGEVFSVGDKHGCYGKITGFAEDSPYNDLLVYLDRHTDFEFLSDLKKVTPKPEKDYEILNWQGDSWKVKDILSVKRLSDGEVFSVGDLHTGSQFDDPREILEIIESDGEIIFYQKRGNTNLDKAKKVTRTPILTTEDGVEQIEKDYEILDVTLKHCNPTFKRSLLSPSETEMIDKIISVKRLSDGVVVSVRDKVENKNFPEHNGEVYEIEELDGEIYVYYTKNRGCDLLKDICKSRQPILTTEDGVELFEGDKHCWVDDDMHIGEDLTDKSDPAPGFKYFFTKEAAEVYRLNNARLLSVKDIAENDPNLTKATANRLRELVKSRLS